MANKDLRLQSRSSFNALLLALPALGLIWCFNFGATLDLPNHLARANILNNCLFSHSGSSCDYFNVSFVPIPYFLSDCILSLILKIVPSSILSEKVALTLAILILSHAWTKLYYSVNNRFDCFWILGAPFLVSNFLLTGFFAFVLSIAISLYALSYWWPRRDSLTPVTYLNISLLIILGYSTHLSALPFIGFPIMAYYFFSIVIRQKLDFSNLFKAFLNCAPILGTFLILYITQQLLTSDTANSPLAFRSITKKIMALTFPFANFHKIYDSILVLVPYLLIFLVVIASKKYRTELTKSFWLFASLVFFMLFAISPVEAMGVYDVDVRFLGVSFFFLLIAFGNLITETHRGFKLITTISLVSYFSIAFYYKYKIDMQLKPAWEFMSYIEKDRKVLLVNSIRNIPDPQNSRISPFPYFPLHLFAENKVSYVSGLFTCKSNQNISYFCFTDKNEQELNYFNLQFEGIDHLSENDLKIASKYYDTILVISPKDEAEIRQKFKSSAYSEFKHDGIFYLYQLGTKVTD